METGKREIFPVPEASRAGSEKNFPVLLAPSLNTEGANAGLLGMLVKSNRRIRLKAIFYRTHEGLALHSNQAINGTQ
jgi:hypothetical protein